MTDHPNAIHCAHCSLTSEFYNIRVQTTCPFCGNESIDLTEARYPSIGYQEELIFRPQVSYSDAKKILAKQFRATDSLGRKDQRLLRGLRPYFISIWLSDVDVKGDWAAELGHPYEGITATEVLQRDRAKIVEHTAERYHWSIYKGRIDKSYTNIIGFNGVHNHQVIQELVLEIDLSLGEPFDATFLKNVIVTKPVLTTVSLNKLTSHFKEQIRRLAITDCQKAAQLPTSRFFQWKPLIKHTSWTFMLVPVYLTYYQHPFTEEHIFFAVNGINGNVHIAK